MLDDLTKTFFDTFGIEPKEEKYCYWECKKPELENVACNNTECEHYRHKIHYPQITDRILLELICIAMDVTDFGASDVEALKNVVLEVLIDEIKSEYSTKKEKKHIVNQVQALFKEGN